MVPNPDYWDTTPAQAEAHEPDRHRRPRRRDADRRAQDRRRSTAPTAIALSTLRPAGDRPVGQGLPGRAVRHRGHGDQRHQGPAGRRRRCARRISAAVDRTGPHQHRLPGRRQHPARARGQRHLGLRRRAPSQSAYDALPPMTQDLTKAKSLTPRQPASPARPITIGTSSGIPTLNTEALAVKAGSARRSASR